MKLISNAIASIVDANTHYLDAGQGLDYGSALRHGREVRGKSISASLKSLGRVLRSALERYRRRREEKREVAGLLKLNDVLLRDIGLSREDLIAVQFGATTLAKLQTRREAASNVADQRGRVRSIKAKARYEAANEATFATAKCA
jgi:uncharacterized protein YjiS (DUF1127 family)